MSLAERWKTPMSESETQFVMDHVVVRVGTERPMYALARDDRNYTIVGPLRRTKKAAYLAGRKAVLGF